VPGLPPVVAGVGVAVGGAVDGGFSAAARIAVDSLKPSPLPLPQQGKVPSGGASRNCEAMERGEDTPVTWVHGVWMRAQATCRPR
jgi:hypothetical protein